MKKLDRFERMVLSQFERWRSAVGDTAQWHCPDVIKLLRKEHAWMVRMVLKEKREITELAFKTRQSTDPRDIAIADRLYARVTQCEDILHRLHQRRK